MSFIKNKCPDNSPHRFLLDLIPVGEKNAIHQDDLARLLNTDRRSLRARIERARIAGFIIASTDIGYYIPANAEELRHYVLVHNARITTAQKALKGAKTRLLQEGDIVAEG